MSHRYNLRRTIITASALTLTTSTHAEDVTTSTGRWRGAAPQVTLMQGQVLRSGARDGLITTQALPTMTLSNATIVPVVSRPDDLALLLTGRASGPRLRDHMKQLMQIVPEVPPDFDGQEFEQVRQALSPCMSSASAYRDIVLSLADEDDVEAAANSFAAGEAANNYERNCMTRLADVPLAVRQITGVLVTQLVPWCSATIVGSNRLLTLRHCFVHPDGTPTEAYARVAPSLVSFAALEEHGGQRSFTVTWNGDPPPLVPFTALQDWLVLTIRDGAFEHYVRPQPVQAGQGMPQSVWVVGSNAHLGDLTSGRPALEFTRASAPKACAIVRVTPSGCIYHTCQTGPATSGAGMLALATTGTVTLLGVHKARISEAGSCESSPPYNDVLNLAVNITSQQIE